MAYFAVVWRCLLVVVCVLVLASAAPGDLRAQTPVVAGDAFDDAVVTGTSWQQKSPAEKVPSMEAWIGGEGYRRVASLYSGVTWAPLGGARQDGLRLRVVAGQTLYHYAGSDYDPVTAKNFTAQFVGLGRFVDVLAGWQFTVGDTTIKAFGGLAGLSHAITPYDPSTHIQGTARGAKGVLEIWHNWTPMHWTSLDISLQSTYGTATAQLRDGWRVSLDGWSIGPEAKLVDYSDTNRDLRSTMLNARLGLFIRYEDRDQEFILSGGGLRELTMQVGQHTTVAPLFGYAGTQYLRRF